LDAKIKKFNSFLEQAGSGLVALSGGVDSSVLLALASKIHAFKCQAVTIDSPAHPAEEIRAAIDLCKRFRVKHTVLRINELDNPLIKRNGSDRCYHCKHDLYSILLKLAAKENLSIVLDGSNIDDLDDYRPGMQAIRELGISVPLVNAGFTKSEIRKIARDLDLPIWNLPPSACLYTRIPVGEQIELKRVQRISQAEKILKYYGFRIFRVRDHGILARIELHNDEIEKLNNNLREIISNQLKQVGYRYVCLDLCGYKKGSMNIDPSKQ